MIPFYSKNLSSSPFYTSMQMHDTYKDLRFGYKKRLNSNLSSKRDLTSLFSMHEQRSRTCKVKEQALNLPNCQKHSHWQLAQF